MTLWTPDGEYPIKPKPEQPPSDSKPEGEATTSKPSTPAHETELTPEQEEQARVMAQGLSEARQQLLEANVADVVANHAFGLYELAAIHLTADKPDMAAARLGIDALGAVVEGLTGRLGEAEQTLTEALQQIRLMFVQRTTQLKNATDSKDQGQDSSQGQDD